MKLLPHDPAWAEKYKVEAEIIRSALSEDIIDIQHIGSTAINSIAAKPIIDIAVLISEEEYLQAYTNALSKIGYIYYPESSSVERLFFRKGEPAEFHLSLTQEGKTSYWKRQIMFRDYLNTHPEVAKEYEALKFKLLESDPAAGQTYSGGKSEFVKDSIRRARMERD